MPNDVKLKNGAKAKLGVKTLKSSATKLFTLPSSKLSFTLEPALDAAADTVGIAEGWTAEAVFEFTEAGLGTAGSSSASPSSLLSRCRRILRDTFLNIIYKRQNVQIGLLIIYYCILVKSIPNTELPYTKCEIFINNL